MFCINIKNKLRALLRCFDTVIDAHIEIALSVTAGLKQMLSSPVADIVTAIIPGDIDNLIRQQLISALSQAIEALTIADTCRQHTEVNDQLNCFIQQLQLRDPHLQEAVLQKMASLIAGFLDGRRLKQSMYDLYTQARYAITKE